MEGPTSDPSADASRVPGPPPALARLVLLSTLGLAAVAWSFGDRPLFPSLLAGFLLVYFPIVSLATPTEGLDLGPKTALYRGTAIMLLVLGALSAWGWWGLDGHGRGSRLLAPPEWRALALHSLSLLAACLIVMAAFYLLSGVVGWRERSLVRRLMPEGPREKRGFVLLSVAAGFGEELAYRAFAPLYLMAWGGSYITAAFPCALAFGCLHRYQGPHGILRTGVIGFVLALGVDVTGSLWPAVVAHALLNIVVGLFLGETLLGDVDTAAGSDPLP